MANALLATGVMSPQIDTMGSFAQGAGARQAFDANNIALARQGLENIGAIALGAMDGNINGQADPAKFEQGLDLLEEQGIDVTQFRGKPGVAPLVVRASLTAQQQLAAAQDQRTYDLAMKKFQMDVAEAAKGPKPTADQQEYQQAVEQGFKGTLMDYQQAMKKAGAQTINVGPTGIDYGDPGAGYVWQRDPKTNDIVVDERGAPIAIPFKGGKPYQAEQDALKAGTIKEAREDVKQDLVLDDLGRAISNVTDNPFFTSGAGAQATGWMDGTPAADVRGMIKSIVANLGFDQLQAMREASPTGGALGQVTEKELAFLQGVLGDLTQAQSAPQLLYNLKRVKNIYLDIVHGEGAGPPREELGNAPGGPDDDLDPATMSDEDLLTLIGAD